MEIENIFKQTDYPLIALAIAAIVALVLGFVVQAVGRRILLRITKRFSIMDALVRSTIGPMQLIMPLIFLQFVWLATPNDWEFMPRVRHMTGLVFIAAISWLVIRCIGGVTDTIVSLRPLTIEDNLHARRIQTQARVIARSLMVIVMLVGGALMLMTFPAIRAVGASLLASAGLVGIIAGVAARPVLSNMIAGLQLALSQPLRLDDVVVVEGEWGRIEDITGTYIVIALWDQRRLIVPLQYFIEKPFQNWTRSTSEIIGTVFWWVDYGMPLAPLREELNRLCNEAPEWDKRISLIQVTDTTERTMQLRALVTSQDSGKNFDLRCKVREGLISFMQKNYPDYLPRDRNEISNIEKLLPAETANGDANVNITNK
jgi:small-conductance mechanosensitive channel